MCYKMKLRSSQTKRFKATCSSTMTRKLKVKHSSTKIRSLRLSPGTPRHFFIFLYNRFILLFVQHLGLQISSSNPSEPLSIQTLFMWSGKECCSIYHRISRSSHGESGKTATSGLDLNGYIQYSHHE